MMYKKNSAEIKEVGTKLTALEVKMDNGFKAVDERFNVVDERFNMVDERFSRVENRLGEIEIKLDWAGEKIFIDHEKRRAKLEVATQP